jgi:pSer/pThr/pTyr-binding forkhead associated (FHA) protein
MFSAIVSEEDEQNARKTGTLIAPSSATAVPRLLITAGPQEGAELPLFLDTMTVGRTTTGTTWDISLQDRSVSRPHCRLTKSGEIWSITDLGSANGTTLNGAAVNSEPRLLKDGDVLTIGETTLLFRAPAP